MHDCVCVCVCLNYTEKPYEYIGTTVNSEWEVNTLSDGWEDRQTDR